MIFWKGFAFILGIGMNIISIIYTVIKNEVWWHALPLCLFGLLLIVAAIFIKDNGNEKSIH
jgi:hypothetical protein